MTPVQLPLWTEKPDAVPCLGCGAHVARASLSHCAGRAVWPARCPVCGASEWFDLAVVFGLVPYPSARGRGGAATSRSTAATTGGV